MKWIFIIAFMMMIPVVKSQEYYFRQMTLDFDGDIQKIKLLFQGKDQMIWMGTDQGLYFFDGRRSWHIGRPDGTTNEVTAIAENQEGEIWAGYEDGFIHVVSFPGQNKVIPTDSLKGVTINKILFGENGDAFIATYGKSIWRFHDNQLIRIGLISIDIKDIYDAILDVQGRLWLATDRGIWIYQQKPNEDFRHIDREIGLPDEIVSKLLPEKNGDVWIGLFDHGLARYQTVRDSIINVEAIKENEGSVINLLKGQSDDIWFATEKIIGRYSISETVHRIQVLPDMIKKVDDILFDHTGNLWVASGNKLFMANTQLDHRIPDVTGIQSITSLDGRLWLGCQSGLYSMDEEGGEILQHLQEEQLNILNIYVDPNKYLWLGTFGQGLYIYDPYTTRLRRLTEKDKLSNNSILNIDGKDNTLWLATLGGITEISWASDPFKDELDITSFQEKFKFPPEYVYDVYVGKDDKVWFGTAGKGLYYLEHNQLFPFNHSISLPGQDSFEMKTIYNITVDQKNNIWISGSKGNILNIDINGNLLKHISTAHGSLSSLITAGNGEIVMVCEGTVQIKNPIYGLTYFSTSTGPASFSPNLIAVSKDIDGSIWIAEPDYILHYVPSPSDSAKYVHMHLVDVTPGSLHPMGTIRLRPDSNFLDLRFTGLWYPDPSRVQYRYRLKGHDQDWIYTQEGRAVYSRLSPGTYTFVVEGSYNEDFSRSQSLQRQIVVLSPFYFTWWFILLCLFLILFVSYQFIRSRLRHINKLHQLEKEKTTLQLHAIQAQVNPHFLFNSFNTLSSIIEEDQKSAVAYVDQLSGFFRGVLMHRDSELIPLDEEIIIMRNYAYILQKRYGDNIRIIEKISAQEGYIAPLSIQLLIENAIKHNKVTKEKPLTVTISIDEKWVIVSNPIQQKIQAIPESTGFGLSSLLTRYQYLTAAKIDIQNDGNVFLVKIPIIHLNHKA